MFTAWLVLVTAAVLHGEEPPRVLAPFQSLESCEVVRAQQRTKLEDDLRDMGAALACVRISMSDA